MGKQNLCPSSIGAPWTVKNAVDRIKAAAEMGDVMKITSIAKELECESDGMASFCNQLIQMAEDFDFNGIQNFMIKLDR